MFKVKNKTSERRHSSYRNLISIFEVWSLYDRKNPKRTDSLREHKSISEVYLEPNIYNGAFLQK